jgi:structural maintenance of chromosome 2
LKQHSLELLQKRLEGSDVHQLTQNKAKLEDELSKTREELKAAQDKKQEQILLAKSLEDDINNFGKDKDKRIKAAKEKVKQAKFNLETCKKVLKAAESAVQVALAEHDNSVQERASLLGQVQTAKENIRSLEQQVEQLGITVKETKTLYDESNSRLEELRLRLKECDSEIAAALKERDGLQKQRNDSIIDRKKIFNR